MKTGGFWFLCAFATGTICCILYFASMGDSPNERSPIIVVDVPAHAVTPAILQNISAAPDSTGSQATNAKRSSTGEGVAIFKSVDTEHRDSVWANPTERELREQARRIPGIDDGSIVTRCASTVCDLIVRASEYASPDEKKVFTKYVKGDALPISLTNTNALIGYVRMSNYDNRLTATMTLDRIHR